MQFVYYIQSFTFKKVPCIVSVPHTDEGFWNCLCGLLYAFSVYNWARTPKRWFLGKFTSSLRSPLPEHLFQLLLYTKVRVEEQPAVVPHELCSLYRMLESTSSWAFLRSIASIFRKVPAAPHFTVISNVKSCIYTSACHLLLYLYAETLVTISNSFSSLLVTEVPTV